MIEAGEVITVRDLLAVAGAFVTFLGGALYAITWREILASRRRGHLHGGWLTDHESFAVRQGKPPYDPKD